MLTKQVAQQCVGSKGEKISETLNYGSSPKLTKQLQKLTICRSWNKFICELNAKTFKRLNPEKSVSTHFKILSGQRLTQKFFQGRDNKLSNKNGSKGQWRS